MDTGRATGDSWYLYFPGTRTHAHGVLVLFRLGGKAVIPVRQARVASSLVRQSIAWVRQRGRRIGTVDVDLLETADQFLIHADAPGVEEDDVQVRYVDGEVFLRIDRFRHPHDGFELVVDGRSMSLDGRVSLPEMTAVDPTLAEATLNGDGTLHITIPKGEAVADSTAQAVTD